MVKPGKLWLKTSNHVQVRLEAQLEIVIIFIVIRLTTFIMQLYICKNF